MQKIVFILTVAFLSLFPSSSDSQMFCEQFELKEESIDTFVGLLSDYYQTNYSSNYPSFDEARGPLTNFLMDQIVDNGFSDECYPGDFWYSGYTRESVIDGIQTNMYFRWNIDFALMAQHKAILYDFMIGDISESFSENHSEKEGIIASSKNLDLKLLLLFTNCTGAIQSKAYGMIIIDRDIHIPVVNGACVPDNPGVTSDPGPGMIPVPRKIGPSKSALKVYPNPASDGPSTIAFDLPVDQKITMHLVAANSGKVVRQLLHGHAMKAGNHTLKMQSENLGSGLYYVVLQSETERIVKKLIKM